MYLWTDVVEIHLDGFEQIGLCTSFIYFRRRILGNPVIFGFLGRGRESRNCGSAARRV